jgi:hypothetical protein
VVQITGASEKRRIHHHYLIVLKGLPSKADREVFKPLEVSRARRKSSSTGFMAMLLLEDRLRIDGAERSFPH